MRYDKRNKENLMKLADHTKIAALNWYGYCLGQGVDILIYETIRTKEQQKINVAQGASQTMRSYHIVGQALDFVPVNAKGETLWNGYDTKEIKKIIAEAKRLGFEWGGDWKTFIDKPHLQYNHKGYGTDTFGKVEAKPLAKEVEKEVSVQIRTGGLSYEMEKEVSAFIREKRWWAQIQHTSDGKNPTVITGGLDPNMRKEFEEFLNNRGWWFTIVK